MLKIFKLTYTTTYTQDILLKTPPMSYNHIDIVEDLFCDIF